MAERSQCRSNLPMQFLRVLYQPSSLSQIPFLRRIFSFNQVPQFFNLPFTLPQRSSLQLPPLLQNPANKLYDGRDDDAAIQRNGKKGEKEKIKCMFNNVFVFVFLFIFSLEFVFNLLNLID